MKMNETELRGALEAILFLSNEPIRIDDLAAALPETTVEAIAGELQLLKGRLEESFTGFSLEETAGGYRFATRPEFDSHVKRFFSRQGEGRLSLAALETLAIIAYRQPVTSPEISEIRGVNSSGVLRTLLERKMIRIAGRKNVVGSPFLYRTTREFLIHFGLNAIQDLPQLEEFTEILGENMVEELTLASHLDAADTIIEEEAAAGNEQRRSGMPSHDKIEIENESADPIPAVDDSANAERSLNDDRPEGQIDSDANETPAESEDAVEFSSTTGRSNG